MARTMHKTRPRKTLDDYLRVPDDVRVELIDGEIFVSPAPRFRHQQVLLRLAQFLQSFAQERKLGEIIVSPFDCVLSNEDVVQPDLIFLRTGQLQGLDLRLYGPPDVAIEVLSAGHAERDRIVKRDLYAKYGVPEFWIVDTDEKTVEVMRLENGAWTLVGIFAGEDAIVSPTFEGLELKAVQAFG